VSESDELLPIVIRKMVDADIPEVSRLDKNSFTLPWPEKSYYFEVNRNQFSRCWVAETETWEHKTVIAGMIVVWLIVDEVHIATFAIHPDYRKQKIGQRLLAHTLIEAFHSGALKSFLEVRSGNSAARALYRKFGYEEIGIRKHYYKDNAEDAVMMNLEKIDLQRLKSFV
jgi:ribosomal-protein-alanine N-acetyltransferase